MDDPVTTVIALINAINWLWLLGAIHTLLAVLAVIHALLYKRDPRAALGWVSVCLLFPVAGPILYYVFGINRIQTHARRLTGKPRLNLLFGHEKGGYDIYRAPLSEHLPHTLQRYAVIGDRVTALTLQPCNNVTLLHNGEEAYPAMLEAIAQARQSVYLMSYIFQNDTIGRRFADALTNAHQRGVAVYVLIDGVGEYYSLPRIGRRLKKSGIHVGRFLRPRLIPLSLSINLRNHRKVLIVDQQLAFTGGMNIADRHLVQTARHPHEDLHFSVRGPVVEQLTDIFRHDWQFVSRQPLPATNVQYSECGDFYARCISDGPDDDLDKIAQSMLGAMSAARTHIRIVTPYFLPSREMIASLQSAALRGVDVEIILPQKSNLRIVDWATRNLLWELLHYGIKVYYQQNGFAHTKLLVIDDCYAQLGSANLDPRSLRLNFELNLEVIAEHFAAQALDYINTKKQQSRRVSLHEVETRPLIPRMRDAICWLFTPYL